MFIFEVKMFIFGVTMFIFGVKMFIFEVKMFNFGVKMFIFGVKMFMFGKKLYFRSKNVNFRSKNVYFRSKNVNFRSNNVYFQGKYLVWAFFELQLFQFNKEVSAGRCWISIFGGSNIVQMNLWTMVSSTSITWSTLQNVIFVPKTTYTDSLWIIINLDPKKYIGHHSKSMVWRGGLNERRKRVTSTTFYWSWKSAKKVL